MNTGNCETCGKTEATLKARNQERWQCSHVDCPRRRSPMADLPDRARPDSVDGCYRVNPHFEE